MPCPVKPESQTPEKKSGAVLAEQEPQPISIQDYDYGPNPVCLPIGELIFFKFKVVFADTPPPSFLCTIEIYDRKKNLIKSLQQTFNTNGQSSVTVEFHWDGKKDNGDLIPPGGYGPHVIIHPNFANLAKAAVAEKVGDYGDGDYGIDICSGIQTIGVEVACKSGAYA